MSLADRLAPISGFRNVLVHDDVAVDWDVVYGKPHDLDDLFAFADHVRVWLKEQKGLDD